MPGRRGLDADADPVHPGVRVRREEGLVDVVGIALDGDLRTVEHGDRADDRRQRVGRHQGGGPAADEHGGGCGHARLARAADLGPQCGEVAVDEVCAIGPGGESAVVALRRAERHVHVDTERSLHGTDARPGRRCRTRTSA